ncbi:MAG: hypothetical protein FWF12_03540 [Betaproteobacteria bacterium]|nr:hypothetical protein [Betaproteobacteria bacterium]
MSSRTKLAVAIVATFLAVSGVRAATRPSGPAEALMNFWLQGLQKFVSKSISQFGTTFSDGMQNKFEQIISAIAVATAQEAISGNVVAEAHRQAGMMALASAKAQQENTELLNAVSSFAPRLGQGYDLCGTMYKNKAMTKAYADLAARARAKVASLDVAPGRLAKDVSRAMLQRLSLHRQKFCTKAEADKGLCTESALPGGDVNAALLFEPAPADSLQATARTAYIQHVVGTPNPSVQPKAGSAPDGQNYLISQNRLDAMRSAAAYSLAVIDAKNTQNVRMPNGAITSPNELLKLRVNQYFGGKDAQDWSDAMAVQSQRGLTVEAAKMAGLSAWMEYEELKNLYRSNVLYANLLISASDAMRSELDNLHNTAGSNAATGAIK